MSAVKEFKMLWSVIVIALEILALCNARHIEINPDASSESEVISTKSFPPLSETTAATLSKHILNSSKIVESSTVQRQTYTNRGHILQNNTIGDETNLIVANEKIVPSQNVSTDHFKMALKQGTDRTVDMETETIEDTHINPKFETSSETITHQTKTNRITFQDPMRGIVTMSALTSDIQKHISSTSADIFENLNSIEDSELEKNTIYPIEKLSAETTTMAAKIEDILVELNLSRKLESSFDDSNYTTTKSNNVISHLGQLEDSSNTTLAAICDVEVAMVTKYDETYTSFPQNETTTHSNHEIVSFKTHNPDKLISENSKDQEKNNNQEFIRHIFLPTDKPILEETTYFELKLSTEIPIDKHMEIKAGVPSYTNITGPKSIEIGEVVPDLLNSTITADTNFLPTSALDSIETPSLYNEDTEPLKLDNLRETTVQLFVSPEIVRPKNVQPPNDAIEDLIEQTMETLNAPKEVEELLEREIEESFNTPQKLEIRQNISQINPLDNDPMRSTKATSDTNVNISIPISNEISDPASISHNNLKTENVYPNSESKTSVFEKAGESLLNNTENLSISLRSSSNVGESNVDNGKHNLQILKLKELTLHVVKKANPDMKTLPLIPEIDRILVENYSEKLNKTKTDEETQDFLRQVLRSNKDYNSVNKTLILENKRTANSNNLNIMTEAQDALLENAMQTDMLKNENFKTDNEKLSGLNAVAKSAVALQDDHHHIGTSFISRESLTNNSATTVSYLPTIFTITEQSELNTFHNLSSKAALENNIEKNNGLTLPENDPFIPGKNLDIIINNNCLDKVEHKDILPNASNLNTSKLSFDMEIPPRNEQIPLDTDEAVARRDINQSVYQGRSMLSEELIVPQSPHIKTLNLMSTNAESDSPGSTHSDLTVSTSLIEVLTTESDSFNSNLIETIVEDAELTTENSQILLAFHSSIPQNDGASVSHNQIVGDSIDSKLVESRSLASSSFYLQIESFNLTVIIAISIATLFLISSLLLVVGIKLRNHHATLNIEMAQQGDRSG